MVSSAVEKRPRLDSLTGLRWWAAFGVFAYHMANLAPLRHQNFFNVGYTGVSFFFVLSGFVLTWSQTPTTGVRQFWWRRFARIWPAHICALLPCLVIFYSFHPDPNSPWVKEFSVPILLLSVVLLQGFFTNPVILFSGNPAAWTLSCEMFFYFLHPLVSPRAGMKKKHSVLMLGVALLVGISFCLLRRKGVILPPPLERLWEFFLGMALAHLMRKGTRIRFPAWTVYGLLGFVVAYYWILNSHFWQATGILFTSLRMFTPVILASLYTLAIGICTTADLDKRHSPFRSRLLVTGGEWSYAFYLVHATVLYGVRSLTGVVPWGVYTIPLWIGVFLLSLLAAGLLHLAIEKPIEKRMRRWGDNKFAPRMS